MQNLKWLTRLLAYGPFSLARAKEKKLWTNWMNVDSIFFELGSIQAETDWKFQFSVNAEFWKIEKIPKKKKKKKKKKCHSIKNTFLFPNLRTRAPKLMIKPKNNFKNLIILVKIHFLTKLQFFRKNDKYWKKWVKSKFISIFDHYEMFWHQKMPPVFFLLKAISCQRCCMSTFLTCSFLKILNLDGLKTSTYS